MEGACGAPEADAGDLAGAQGDGEADAGLVVVDDRFDVSAGGGVGCQGFERFVCAELVDQVGDAMADAFRSLSHRVSREEVAQEGEEPCHGEYNALTCGAADSAGLRPTNFGARGLKWRGKFFWFPTVVRRPFPTSGSEWLSPPPCGEEAGGGGRISVRAVRQSLPSHGTPSPYPLPTRGEGRGERALMMG